MQRSALLTLGGFCAAILLVVVLVTTITRPAATNAQAKNFQGIFQLIAQQAETDPLFPFTIQSYGLAGGNYQAVGLTVIEASANSIVDIGDDYVCLGSIQMTEDPANIKTVCIPFSAIIQVQMQNSVFE